MVTLAGKMEQKGKMLKKLHGLTLAFLMSWVDIKRDILLSLRMQRKKKMFAEWGENALCKGALFR